jgi:hypothetical protein
MYVKEHANCAPSGPVPSASSDLSAALNRRLAARGASPSLFSLRRDRAIFFSSVFFDDEIHPQVVFDKKRKAPAIGRCEFFFFLLFSAVCIVWIKDTLLLIFFCSPSKLKI